MHILFVTPYLPSLIRARPYNLIRELVRLGHSITLLTAAGTSPDEQEQANTLKRWGVQVEVFPVSLWRSLGNCLQALPTREPLQAVYAYQPQMEQRLAQLLREETFDVVHIEHLRSARLVRAVSQVPTVYDSVDCISLLFEQAAKIGFQLRHRLMTLLDLARTRRYEALLLTRYNQVVVTSERDKQALEDLAQRYLPPQAQTAPITIVTNGVDTEYFDNTSRPRDAQTIIFSGKMSYHANVSGVLNFAQQVLPHIWAENPEVRFQIVGKDPPEAIQRLAEDNRIQVTGYVDDLRPYLAQATVAVCSVPYAVGVQFKVLEAMAMGTPVVCTLASFSGLQAQEEDEILVADGPKTFAAHVLRVISDQALRERLQVAGRRYVENHHSWEAGARRLEKVYQRAQANDAARP
jgi:glycosyltransferase involved in cell wall biosynthesis